MAAVHQTPMGDSEETPEAVVARIQARGRGTLPPKPTPEAIAHIVARVADEQPLSAEEEVVWNRAWVAIDNEMRERDRENAITEGRR